MDEFFALRFLLNFHGHFRFVSTSLIHHSVGTQCKGSRTGKVGVGASGCILLEDVPHSGHVDGQLLHLNAPARWVWLRSGRRMFISADPAPPKLGRTLGGLQAMVSPANVDLQVSCMLCTSTSMDSPAHPPYPSISQLCRTSQGDAFALEFSGLVHELGLLKRLMRGSFLRR